MALFAYSDVVCKRLFDVVPKQVHLFLVDDLCDGLVDWMLKKATTRNLEVWLAEDPKFQRKRREVERKLSQFEGGIKILADARESGY